MIAQLVEADVSYACPVTNLYKAGDKHFLVTVRDDSVVGSVFEGVNGFSVPLDSRHVSTCVEVFLADERGQVIDYDGDPANGLTPILSTDSKSFAMTIIPELVDSENPYVDALAALGYSLES